MSDLEERLRGFEGSDALGEGDFSVCAEAAETLRRYREALEGIATFGTRHPGHGYSCATLARQALGEAG